MSNTRSVETQNDVPDAQIEPTIEPTKKENKYHTVNDVSEALKSTLSQTKPGHAYSIEYGGCNGAIVRKSKKHGKKINFFNSYRPYYDGVLSSIFTIEWTYIINDKRLQVKPTHELIKLCKKRNATLKDTLAAATKEHGIATDVGPYLNAHAPFLVYTKAEPIDPEAKKSDQEVKKTDQEVMESDLEVILRMSNLKDPQTNEGMDLFEFINTRNKKQYLQLSDGMDAVKIAISIIEGFIPFHKKYVHADVKPANIFVKRQQAYIIDFGLTKRIRERSEVVGSPLYLSPARLELIIQQREFLNHPNGHYNPLSRQHIYQIEDDKVGIAKTLLELLLGESAKANAKFNDIATSKVQEKDPILYELKEVLKLHDCNFRDYANPYQFSTAWREKICHHLEKFKRNELQLSDVLKKLNELLSMTQTAADQLIVYANDLLACIQHPFWQVDAKHALGEAVAAQMAHTPFTDLLSAETFLLKMKLACKEQFELQFSKAKHFYGLSTILQRVGTFSTPSFMDETKPSTTQIKTFLQLIGDENHQLSKDYYKGRSAALENYISSIPAMQTAYLHESLRPITQNTIK